MAITKQFKAGNPADDAEIVEANTNRGKLDDNTAGAGCVAHRTEAMGETNKYFDAKQAFTYVAGTWQVIVDEVRGCGGDMTIKIIVTNAVGAQQRVIHDFGNVTITACAESTFTVNCVAEQILTATERLAVFMEETTGGCCVPRLEIGVDNFDGTCDSRLITPDAAAGGGLSIPVAMHGYRQRRVNN